jgi:hypothetical protein
MAVFLCINFRFLFRITTVYTLFFRIYHPFDSVYERDKNVKHFCVFFVKFFKIYGVSRGLAYAPGVPEGKAVPPVVVTGRAGPPALPSPAGSENRARRKRAGLCGTCPEPLRNTPEPFGNTPEPFGNVPESFGNMAQRPSTAAGPVRGKCKAVLTGEPPVTILAHKEIVTGT